MRSIFIAILISFLLHSSLLSQDQQSKYFIEKGIAFYKMRIIDSAIYYYNKAIVSDSLSDEAYFRRALARSKLRDNEGAISDYRTAIRINPKPLYYNNLGIIFTVEEYHEEALIEFNKALKLDSTYVQAIFNKGISYHHMGMREQACKYATKARDMGLDAAGYFCREFCP
jgi:tetratricopeptide (TPR) repeat protein